MPYVTAPRVPGHHRRWRRLTATVLAGSFLLLTGCAATVSMTPATGANSPLCAQVTVHLPSRVTSTLSSRDTNAQATAAWGTPTSVLLRCGVSTPAVSTLPCFTMGRVDWLLDQEKNNPNIYLFTTYGRTPGVEVIVDSTRTSSDVLTNLGPAIRHIPATKKCVGLGDAPAPSDTSSPRR